ncbi:MAG: SPFH domain-containing protein [Mariprofundales bacterium]
MSFLDGIQRQLRSVIEWKDPSPNAIFYRWSENGDEIKDASKLIIGPGLGCLFVYEGRVRAIHMRSGMVDLKTDNIPFITTVMKLMQSFVSEHKVGIYFFRRTRFLNQKWGTTSDIKYEDPKYHFPVALRAFGNSSFRISDPGFFFTQVVGGAESYTVEEFRQVINHRLLQPLVDFFAESRYTYTDIDANREEIAAAISARLDPVFRKLGFQMTDLRIEGTSFDQATMRRIDRIADTIAEQQAAQAAGLDYRQMQQMEAMRDAARNEGGGAGVGMGIGAGMGLGQMMAGGMAGKASVQGGDLQEQQDDPMALLAKLKQMHDAELISDTEYADKKKEVLARL